MTTSMLTRSGPPVDPAAPPPDRGRTARFVRGRPADPRWARPGMLGLLAGTAVHGLASVLCVIAPNVAAIPD